MARGFCDSMTDDVFEEKLEGAQTTVNVLGALGNIFNNLAAKNGFKTLAQKDLNVDIPIGETAIYSCDQYCTNKPSALGTFWMILIHLSFSDLYAVEFAFSIGTANSGKVCMRTIDNGAYNAWKTFTGT